MYTNRPDSNGWHSPFTGARHIWTSAAYERLVDAEDEDATYHVETPVGMHADPELFTGGTVAKRVSGGGTFRGAPSLVPVADLYDSGLDFLASDDVCPSCRDQWLRQTGQAGRPDVERRLEGEA